ncbi:MAG TPA: hypothetical protein DCM87_03990 [Planctomycetes bacterium]|nr:hypothetical protein [Planctomycetota bacterium]
MCARLKRLQRGPRSNATDSVSSPTRTESAFTAPAGSKNAPRTSAPRFVLWRGRSTVMAAAAPSSR